MAFRKKRLVVSERAVARAKIVGEFVEGKLTRAHAAVALDLSERQVSRLAVRWQRSGILGLEHALAGSASHRRVPQDVRTRVQALAREKYVNFNFQHLHERLVQDEGLQLSYSSLKRICAGLGITKRPRRRRKARKYRDRHAAAGLMLQMDGSDHEWVRGQRWTLIAGIDDATSDVPWGQFFESESLEGYLSVLSHVFEKRGIPCILYVDRAGWLSGTSTQEDTGQFKRICQELGITLIYAHSAQAKGRVERLWGTLQDRLVAELALAGIQEMQEATRYLNERFLPETWSSRFTVAPRKAESMYRASPTPAGLREILCYKYRRKIRNDHTILWNAHRYAITTELGYSLARRELELRLYGDGTIRGYLAGKPLELKRVAIVRDASDSEVEPPCRPGLRAGRKNRSRSKSCLNI